MSTLLLNSITGLTTSTELTGVNLDLYLREYPNLTKVGIATTTNANYYVLLNETTEEFRQPYVSNKLTYNPYSGALNLSGSLSGITTLSMNGAITGITSISISGRLYDGNGSYGSSSQILSSTGSVIQWINASTTNVGSATSIGINLDSTNSPKYLTFVDTSSGNNLVKVDTDLTYNPSTNVLTATSFSGGGSNLTSLTAGNLSGTIPSGVLGNSTHYIGTTAIALNRASASQSLTGINIDGSSGSCTGNAATATTATNQSGGTVSATTGTLNQILMPSTVGSAADAQPTALSYGRLQGYGTFNINADTDASGSEFLILTAGYTVANATAANGLSIGQASTAFTWRNNTIWHGGNDGAGSGLDADLLDGYSSATTATGNTIVLRDANGDDYRRYGFGNYFNSSDDVSAGTLTYLMGKFGDNYYRSATAAKVATFISGQTMNISGSSTSCSGNAATASSVINTVADTGSIELVRGNMADNDQFRILVGGTATDAGYVEIATADNGTEPIYVRQYTGLFSSLTRTATLLDGSGNTSFPGTVSGTNITSGGNVTGSSASAPFDGLTSKTSGSGTYTTSGDFRAPIFYDSNNTGYYTDPASGSNLNTVNATRFSAPNNGLLSVGDDSATYTYNDGSTRSRVYISSTYPVLTLNSTVTNGNTNHGPTIQFSHNGYDTARQWVIGTPGTGAFLDIGTGQGTNYNPHSGISGYEGTTLMRFTTSGNIGLGGDWGTYGANGNPSYPLHVIGTGLASGDFRAPIFRDSDSTGYYIDPASTSNLNGLTLSSTLTITNTDIRSNATSAWTGDPGAQGKIQYHSNRWYIVADSSSDRIVQFRRNGTDVSYIQNDGTFNGSITGNAATATNVAYSGLTGTVPTWNQNTTGSSASCTGNAATATTATNQSGGTVSATTGSFSSTLTVGGAIARSAAGVGYLSGNFPSAETTSTTGAIYTIGGGVYAPTSTSLGNMYGIGYAAVVSGGVASSFGLYVASLGSIRIFLDSDNGIVHATGSVRAPIYYDRDNTSFFTDPASTSVLNNVQVTTFGVGTPASGTAGQIRATGTITASYSDERLKENITTISGAISKVLTLRGVTFNSNKIAEQYGYIDKKEQVGVIAQDVEKVLPQVVVPAPFDIAQDEDGNEYSKSGENYKTVHYDKIVPLLIEAIKELKAEIEELKSKTQV